MGKSKMFSFIFAEKQGDFKIGSVASIPFSFKKIYFEFFLKINFFKEKSEVLNKKTSFFELAFLQNLFWISIEFF
jgi:hypothetical protein